MSRILIISLLSLFLSSIETIQGQQSIKRNKQTTKFHYVQANTHFGYIDENDEGYFDVANSGPSNNVTYRFLSKNQRLLQKGYTKFMAVNSFSSRVSLQFNGGLADENSRNDVFSVRLQNLGLSFQTKWDRTSFFIGYNTVKFGHNPKIDPVSDFTANTTRKDIGFNQDAGLFFRTPIAENIDGELGVSIGGTISKPLAVYDMTNGDWNWMDTKYQGTWLVTGRIGTPVFNALEYGVMAMSGRLTATPTTTRQIHRLGVDFLKKIGETWKFGGQAVAGITAVDNGPNETNYNIQGNIEYYCKGQWIFNISNGILFTDFKDSGLASQTEGQWINSVSYVFSPHTRFRLNNYTNYTNTGSPDWGVTFQVITGFGKR